MQVIAGKFRNHIVVHRIENAMVENVRKRRNPCFESILECLLNTPIEVEFNARKALGAVQNDVGPLRWSN